MTKFSKGLTLGIILGIIIGITGTLLTTKELPKNNQTATNSTTLEKTKSYSTSKIYKELTRYKKRETPIGNALLEDMEWTVEEDGDYTNAFLYKGIFHNWTEINLYSMDFELKMLNKDGVTIEILEEEIYDIKPNEKRAIEIELPSKYKSIDDLNDMEFVVSVKSSDFKKKPFKK